ncbi:MAG: ABC transporter ATP-binding protein [Gammaproteobacteria bacterium]|jgi:Cu-processing system ATP-binding protein|nr:ABC transporter ATP-binding protein [Gammaproteobacteria bacterium]
MRAEAKPAVEVRGVSRHYGSVRAVDGVDLEIRAGEMCGLIGHNGAGKTTLFRMMLGLVPQSAGEILVDGEPVRGCGFRAVRRKIGYLPEDLALYENLTGIETLQFFSRLKGAPPEGCRAALERVGLQDAALRRVREYSKGMRQRLGFAQALLGSPRLLFLDEPTSGLDPDATRGFYAILRELRAAGVTIILSSHVLAEIQERVDRLAIMANGRIRALGTVQGLREQLGLPVRFTICAAPGRSAEVCSALAHLPLGEPEREGDTLRLQCPRGLRLGILEALAGQQASLLDVQMHEPSLEDVFFGLAETRLWK